MEKTKKATAIPGIIAAIAAAALMVCVKYVTPACSGMLETTMGKQVPMKCHWAAVAVFIIGIAMAVNALLAVFIRQNLTSGIVAIVLGVCIFLILTEGIGIGICMKPEMACHLMAPVAKAIASVEVLAGVWMAIKNK